MRAPSTIRTVATPVIALLLTAAVWNRSLPPALLLLVGVGEPFGSLSIMLSGGPDTASLPRDTVFAAVMITTNGIVGICLLVGALRHHVVSFRTEGSSGALAAVLALSTLCLVLPTFTTSSPGPTFSQTGPADRAFRRLRVVACNATSSRRRVRVHLPRP